MIMGKKYKITFDRDNCIGAAACAAVNPDNYEISMQDGKANMKTAEIDEAALHINMEAAQACPVNVIHIFDEEGKKLI